MTPPAPPKRPPPGTLDVATTMLDEVIRDTETDEIQVDLSELEQPRGNPEAQSSPDRG